MLPYIVGVSGGAVGWGTALQIETLRYKLRHCATNWDTALQIEILRYKLSHCATNWVTALQIETLRYRLSHCATDWVTALQIETLRYKLRHCAKNWDCALQIETLRYKLRHCATNWGTALQIETLRYKLRHCATNWDTALQADFRWDYWDFSLTKSFRPHYGSGVDSDSNGNEYEECFLGQRWPVRAADNLATFMCRLSRNCGSLYLLKPKGLSRPVQGQIHLTSYAAFIPMLGKVMLLSL